MPPGDLRLRSTVNASALCEAVSFLRSAPGAARFLIVLNFVGEGRVLDLSRVAASAEVAVATSTTRTGWVNLASLSLDGNEGLVLRL